MALTTTSDRESKSRTRRQLESMCVCVFFLSFSYFFLRFFHAWHNVSTCSLSLCLWELTSLEKTEHKNDASISRHLPEWWWWWLLLFTIEGHFFSSSFSYSYSLTYRRQQTNDEHLKSSGTMTNYRRLVLIQGYCRNKSSSFIVIIKKKERKKVVQTYTFFYFYL